MNALLGSLTMSTLSVWLVYEMVYHYGLVMCTRDLD